MTAATLEPSALQSRAKRLKAATEDAHTRLDQEIMGHAPFASRERYGLFVEVQHGFHREIDALYDDATLDGLLPDLAGRRRLDLITQDLADLGQNVSDKENVPVFARGGECDLPVALGWLYVAEGSNLGAAFLLKAAGRLGLSEEFGARHLAGAPEGRGLHWKTFTAALDAVPLTEADEERVIEAARTAFNRVHGLVSEIFAGRAEADR